MKGELGFTAKALSCFMIIFVSKAIYFLYMKGPSPALDFIFFIPDETSQALKVFQMFVILLFIFSWGKRNVCVRVCLLSRFPQIKDRPCEHFGMLPCLGTSCLGLPGWPG